MARLVLLAGLAIATGLALPGSASALSCAESEGPRFGRAEVAVEGVALSGPREPGVTAYLISPARILVTRYLRGGGPTIVRVETGVSADALIGGAFSPQAGDVVRVVGDRGRDERSFFEAPPPDVVATRWCDPDTLVLLPGSRPHGPAQDRLLLLARDAGALLAAAAP